VSAYGFRCRAIYATRTQVRKPDALRLHGDHRLGDLRPAAYAGLPVEAVDARIAADPGVQPAYPFNGSMAIALA
jgi:hypothetical protein